MVTHLKALTLSYFEQVGSWNYPRAVLTQQCLLFTESGGIAHMIINFLRALKLRLFEILALYSRVVWALGMEPGG